MNFRGWLNSINGSTSPDLLVYMCLLYVLQFYNTLLHDASIYSSNTSSITDLNEPHINSESINPLWCKTKYKQTFLQISL